MGNEHAPNKAAGTDGSATQEDNGDEAEKDADGTTERPAASTGARQNASDLEQTCDFGLQEVFQPGATVLDKYRVIELIASGGVGSVYRVQHLPIGSDFALKCLNRCQPDEALWRRFQNETRAAQKLDHQHFTKVHEFGLLPSGRPYFVMDLVRGITLSDEIKKLGVLPISRAVKIFIQVGFAISYAHDNGIIHRDIKPSNIMLIDVADHSTNDFVRVVDLGIAKLTGQDEFNQQTLTKTGEIFGSPLYMSPEQCKGLGVDHRSDLYSLGCVMYEALTGAPPLIGDTALATMMKHQSEKPLTLQEASLGRKFPPLLEMIVEKLLEKDREKRYQTAKALVADLVQLERQLELEDSASFAQDVTMPLRQDRTSKSAPHTEAQNSHDVVVTATLICLAFLAGIAVTLVWFASVDPASTSRDKKADAGASGAKFFSVIEGAGRTRSFYFPERHLLGFIKHRGQTYPAKGKVTLKDFQPFEFEAGKFIALNPQLFERFRADEVATLDMSFDDSEQGEGADPIISHLARLTGITELELQHSKLTDEGLKGIEFLPNIEKLNVGETLVTGRALSEIQTLYKVRTLGVDDMKDLKPLLNKLPYMPDLKSLHISRCELDSDDVRKIASAKRLTDLDLAGNPRVGDADIEMLSTLPLRALDVQECNITPASIPSFKKMESLRELELSDNWNDASKRLLMRSLPQVKTFKFKPLEDEITQFRRKYSKQLKHMVE